MQHDKNLTNNTLLRRRRNYATLMKVLNNELLVQAKEITEPSIDFHLCLPEIWNVSLQTMRVSKMFYSGTSEHENVKEHNICKYCVNLKHTHIHITTLRPFIQDYQG